MSQLDMPFVIIDYLGFKEMIKSNSIYDAAKKYHRFLIAIENANFPNLNKYIISDSIFIFLSNNTNNIVSSHVEDSIKYFVKIVSIFMQNSFFLLEREDMPLRGAFSFGQYLAQLDFQVFGNEPGRTLPMILGQALVDAYLWEQDQNWIGASIELNSYKRIKNTYPVCLEEMVNANKLIEYPVPTKNGNVDTLAINYIDENNAQSTIEVLLNKSSELKSSAFKNKYDEAIKYVNHVIDNDLFIRYL